MKTTTITVSTKVKRVLEALKRHPRETYNDVLARSLAGPTQDVEGWKETAEILSDPKTMERLARSLRQLEDGNLIPLDDA